MTSHDDGDTRGHEGQPRAPGEGNSHGHVHPPVPEDFHALYDAGFRKARGTPLSAATPDRTEGHHRLAEEVPDLDVQYDEATQAPNFIVTREPAARLSGRAPGAPEDAVTEFLLDRRDLWKLSSADAQTIQIVSVSRPRLAPVMDEARRAERGREEGVPDALGEPEFTIGGLTTVNLVQRVGGIEVFNSDVTAAVNADNQVISVAGQFFAGVDEAPARSRMEARESTFPAEEAVARAAFDLTSQDCTAEDFVPAETRGEGGPYRFYEYRPGSGRQPLAFERPVRVKDVLFPLGDGQFVPGYYMELWIEHFPAFSYVMDAVDTPDVLYRRNLTSRAAFQYRVHNTGDALMRPEDGPAPGTPHPTGVPNAFQAATIPEKLITVESLLAGDPWLPSGATTSDGNNCTAYADLNPPNGLSAGDVLGQATGPQAFDYAYDHGKPASDPTNLQNSLVGMFFHVNWLHDRWYEAGFDEASGNAQKDNFGRGGLGGDPILAEGNDFSGTDNANMTTPADGASPRMQMFEFKKPGAVSRTSNHEALITFHEMGHYITNRLIGNGNGLTNRQGEALGEGWGDFFAISMTSQSTDDFVAGAFAAGGWTDIRPSFKENYYFSIRRYPYSADMRKNPLTFKHIANNVVLPTGVPINANPNGNNEEHNAGEVWCAALWEVFVALVRKHGHAAAEKRMLAYVVGGLKLTPLRPTFTQARDAMMAAVSALSAGDLPEVKAGFARRGMGSGAVSPPSGSTSLSGVVESFTP